MTALVPFWCHGSWVSCDGKPETFVQGDDVVDRYLTAFRRSSEKTETSTEPSYEPSTFMALLNDKESLLLEIFCFMSPKERTLLRVSARDIHDLVSGPQKILSARYVSGNRIEVIPARWVDKSNPVSFLVPKTSIKVGRLNVGDEVFVRPTMMFKSYDQQQDYPRGRIKEIRNDGVHVVETWSWRLANGKGATIFCQWGDVRRATYRTKFEMLPEQRVWKASEMKLEAQRLFIFFQADEKAIIDYESFLKNQGNVDKKQKPPRQEIQDLKNSAFMFVKPHANTTHVVDLVRNRLCEKGFIVESEGEIDGATIARDGLIDKHYHAIANRAVLTPPSELSVSFENQRKFEKAFSCSWFHCVKKGLVHNIATITMLDSKFEASLKDVWESARSQDHIVKLGGGFYVAPFIHDGKELFLINGFYNAMRTPYVQEDSRIHYFSVTWPQSTCDFPVFRDQVLGATDPSQALEGSLRREIFDRWKELGLPGCPTTGDNGVHGSASPFESLCEHHNWLRRSFSNDPFGQALLGGSVQEALLEDWSKDPVVVFKDKQQSLFDTLENLNATECCLKTRAVAANPAVKFEASKRQYIAAVGFIEGDPMKDPDIGHRPSTAPCSIVLAGVAELRITIYNAIATCCKKLMQLSSTEAAGASKKIVLNKELREYSLQASREILSLRDAGVHAKPVVFELTKKFSHPKLFGYMLAKSLSLAATAFYEERNYEPAIQFLEEAKRVLADNPPTKDLAKLMEAQKMEILRMLKSNKALHKKQESAARGRWSNAFKKNSKEADEDLPLSAPVSVSPEQELDTAPDIFQTAHQTQVPSTSFPQQAPTTRIDKSLAEADIQEEDDDQIGLAGWAGAIGAIAIAAGAAIWLARSWRKT